MDTLCLLGVLCLVWFCLAVLDAVPCFVNWIDVVPWLK
jgi:hypothetical protein